MPDAAVAYLTVVAVASTAAVAAYAIDKRRAGAGGRRIPERTLLLLAFAGGWPGAVAAGRHYRHKTKKRSYRVAFGVVVALHLALVGAAAYAVYGRG